MPRLPRLSSAAAASDVREVHAQRAQLVQLMASCGLLDESPLSVEELASLLPQLPGGPLPSYLS